MKPLETSATILARWADTIPHTDVARNAITDPYIRVPVKNETGLAGHSFRAEGLASWLPPNHNGVANRQGTVRKGIAPYRLKSPLRAS